jgi:hypothetical protein
MAEENGKKRPRKLSKVIDGMKLTITAGETVMEFDAANYSKDIIDRLTMYGMSQKLGDAAAGAESVEEAVEFITKINEGLLKGEWSTRAPAAEKVSKKGILEKYEGLSDDEKAVVAPLLQKLGLIK